MKKSTLFTITTLLMFFASLTKAVETPSTIKGIVVDAVTHQPLALANVIVENTLRGAAADNNGVFQITRLEPGTYTIKAQMMGYDPVVKKVNLTPDSNLDLKFEMREAFFQTEKVVVTATRTQKLMENVPVLTELITEAEIKEIGAENIAQVLEDRPGIVIEDNVNGGKSMRMNGVDGRYILVLIDGMPIAGKFNDRLELNLLDINEIEQIEIVKGPSSALYGSEAMGGVVNIITKGFSKALKVIGTGKVGSYDLYSGNIGVKGSVRKWSYSLGADHSRGGVDRNVLSINVNDTENNRLDGKLRYNSDRVGVFEAGTSYNFNEQNANDPIFWTITDVERLDNFFKWDMQVSDRLFSRFKLFFNNYQRLYDVYVRHSGNLSSSDSTKEYILGMKSDFTYKIYENYHIDFGVDYSNDQFKSARVLNAGMSRKQTGVFTQLESKMFNQKLTTIIGARYEIISDSDQFISPRISAMYTFCDYFKLRSSYGVGSRVPSFMNKYIDFDHVAVGYHVIGNPDLKIERSTGFTFGFEYFWNYKALFDVNVFHNRFENLINDFVVSPGVLSYINVDDAVFQGVETQCKIYWFSNLTTTLAYNFTDIYQSGDEQITNVFPHTASVKLNYSIWKKRIRISLRDQLFGERKAREYDQTLGKYLDSKIPRPAYHLLDTTVTFEFSKMFSLRAGVTNLTDFTDVLYGPWIGRRYYSSLEITY